MHSCCRPSLHSTPTPPAPTLPQASHVNHPPDPPHNRCGPGPTGPQVSTAPQVPAMGQWCGEWSVPLRSTPVCPSVMHVPRRGGGGRPPCPFALRLKRLPPDGGGVWYPTPRGHVPSALPPDQRGICSRSALHWTSPWMSVVMSQRRRKNPRCGPRCGSRERLGGGVACGHGPLSCGGAQPSFITGAGGYFG